MIDSQEGESQGCQPARKCTDGGLIDYYCNGTYAECKDIDYGQQCVCMRGFYGDGQQCKRNCQDLLANGYIKHCTDDSKCGEGDKTCYCSSIANEDCNVARDCREIYEAGHNGSGVYYIKPSYWLKAPFKVYCDMTEGGGWTVSTTCDGNYFLLWE
ncbi:Fibrinogen-like protein 1 [Holothuria leucospilota]|uniref:Fibrinogen-like protein 1 n=1 Tax=Holothuria leucospilota TaxID=206669 RepID=A0A9Q1GVE2_HOLLE|nr:Fibrinogen-like protein 1 [Holothuria leucospilota]